MYTKIYNLGLIYATTDVYERLFDAAKFCYENNYKPKSIKLSQYNFNMLTCHPALKYRLGISKVFPPYVEVFGFCFEVDLNLGDQSRVVVDMQQGELTISNALVFMLEENI